MKELSEHTNIVILESEDLVIVSQLEPATFSIKIKVYEQKCFTLNPNPLLNHEQIAQYSICSCRFDQAITDIRDMYLGWSKINKTLPVKLIGIHNQDQNTLNIQFSLGQRYFIYERCPKYHKESVQEELYGKKHHLRLRALSPTDEQYLISKLRFMPRAKKVISFYPMKLRYDLIRRHLSLPYIG